jgi:hypothetical protein
VDATNPRPIYEFPDEDLMMSLVPLYFLNINVFLPLLHRPTFQTAFTASTHLRDDGFAATLLLVCAIGACYSDDPRVLLSGVTSRRSAGWKWYSQVQLTGQFRGEPSLYDLQCYFVRVDLR